MLREHDCYSFWHCLLCGIVFSEIASSPLSQPSSPGAEAKSRLESVPIRKEGKYLVAKSP